MSPPITTILVGNPGAGKSTILNCLVGKSVFEAGVSYGSGKTKTLQMYTAPTGNIFIDTPGLSDVAMMKQAAIEIEKGLRSEGIFKVLIN